MNKFEISSPFFLIQLKFIFIYLFIYFGKAIKYAHHKEKKKCTDCEKEFFV